MPKDKKTKQKERERRVAKQKLEARKAARDKALEEAQKPKSQFAKFVSKPAMILPRTTTKSLALTTTSEPSSPN